MVQARRDHSITDRCLSQSKYQPIVCHFIQTFVGYLAWFSRPIRPVISQSKALLPKVSFYPTSSARRPERWQGNTTVLTVAAPAAKTWGRLMRRGIRGQSPRKNFFWSRPFLLENGLFSLMQHPFFFQITLFNILSIANVIRTVRFA